LNIKSIASGAVLLNRGYSIKDVELVVAKQEKLNCNEVKRSCLMLI